MNRARHCTRNVAMLDWENEQHEPKGHAVQITVPQRQGGEGTTRIVVGLNATRPCTGKVATVELPMALELRAARLVLKSPNHMTPFCPAVHVHKGEGGGI